MSWAQESGKLAGAHVSHVREQERPSTAKVSPARDRGDGDLKATVGSVTVKAGLSVSGRSGKRGKGGRSVPCERCQLETCGSLQLPCGRLVILCESCALEFYDVLIKKIAKFEATFEEFLLEQQEKQTGRVESSKDKETAAKSPERARDRESLQRPVTTHSPQRSSTLRSEKLVSGAAEIPSRGSHSGARAGSVDDVIVTRADVKGGMGGLAGSRRRIERFAPLSGPARLDSPNTAISQAANGRVLNDRTKLQRPATSAAASATSVLSGEGASDRPAGAGKPRTSSFNPAPPSVKVDVTSPASNVFAGALHSSSAAAHVNGHTLLDCNGEYGQSPVPGAGLRSMQTTRSFNHASPVRTSSGGAQNAGIDTPPDSLRQNRQRVHSDTGLLASASQQARSAQNLFSAAENAFHARADQARADPPRITKRLPSGSPLRRGSGSWDKNAPGWGVLTGPSANNAQQPRHTASAHGQRGKWGSNFPGREIERSDGGSPGSPGWGASAGEKTHLSKFQKDDKAGWMGAPAGTIGREWGGRSGTKIGGAKGSGGLSSSAHFAHDSLALTTMAVPGMNDSSPRTTNFKQRPATGNAASMPALARLQSPIAQRDAGLRW